MNELLTMLDTKYKRLEYIQSSGTQYIDTGILANDETGMQVDVQWLNNSDTVCIGSRGTSTATRCFIGSATTGFYLSWNELGSSRPAHNLNRNVLSLNFYNNRKKIFNGTDLSDTLQTLSTQTGNMYLFVANDNGSASLKSSVKMYSAQITQGSILVRNFIPVMRKSDNEIGMLDLVEGKFYGNAGTGKFTANLDTMYALIQGNPTVQDGRVSNFSSSNYLKINEVINFGTKDFEIKCCFIANALQNARVFATDTLVNTLTGINVISTGVIKANFNVNGTRRYIDSSVQYLANVKYYVILYRQGETIGVKVSTDNINWITNTQNINNSDEIISNTNFLLGIDNINSVAFSGTIDLNRSYIKIDDTKYKLQAVVGYTVVGSPTITNGIASGFSSSKYIDISGLDYSSTFSVQVCVKYDENTSVFGIGLSTKFLICVNIAGYFNLLTKTNSSDSWSQNNISWNKVITNKWYWIRIDYDGNGNYTMYYSQDGITYSSKTETGAVLTGTALFNIGTASGSLKGSIDLNNTYIKINNKLWFNGLEA